MSTSLLPGRLEPDAGTPSPTRLVPADLNAVGRRFAAGQTDLDAAVRALCSVSAGSGGMAGDDDPGRQFAAAYDEAAAAAMAVFASGIAGLGGVADGLVASANNYARADGHSTAGGPGSPETFPPAGVIPAPAVGSVPSAAGAGSGAVSLPGALAQFWPAADPGRLRDAAGVWRRMAEVVSDLGSRLHASIAGLVGNNTAPVMALIEQFWGRIWGTGDGPVLVAAVTGCRAIADACEGYAQYVEEVRGEVEEIAIEVVAVTAAGVLLTVFTVGASDAVAIAANALLIARAAEAAAHLVELVRLVTVPLRHAVPLLDLAGRSAPQLVVTEAETEQVTRRVADQMAAAEAAAAGLGPAVVTVAQVPLTVDLAQVEEKYKHAASFGITAPRGRPGFDAFSTALESFVRSPDTVHIQGTYRGEPVILNYDKNRHLVVVQSRDGQFISGWSVSEKQKENIVGRGRL